MKENYYDIEKISEYTYKIYEDFQASMYLVIGSERACLIDTGYGGGDLLGVIASLTDKPLVVVNTHGHIDHVMGNRLFEKVYIHDNDVELYRATCAEFGDIIRDPQVVEEFGDVIAALDPDEVRFAETVSIKDGDVIDLGGIALEVMEVPGHTAGCISLISRAEGFVYSGDSIMEHVWMFLEESLSMEIYLESLKRAKAKLADAGITKIYNGHYAWHPMDTALMDTMIAGTESILAGKAEGKAFENHAGSGVEYEFENWSVLCRAN